jgi:anti-anti-sigma regulatory factor
VILNFAGANELDDDGLSALVFCDAVLRRSGGALKLLNLSRVHIDLTVLRLDTLFEVFKDEADGAVSTAVDTARMRCAECDSRRCPIPQRHSDQALE